MKTLLLLRHAKSSWNDSEISDIDRPLKASGIKDAVEVSEKLKSLKISPDFIITSPAVRALSTSMIFARTFKYDYKRISINEMVYDFSKEALFSLIRTCDDKQNVVMLVGHDPALTFFLNELTGAKLEKIPTCSVAKISFKENHWQKIMAGSGRLEFIESPEKKNKPIAE